MVCGNCGKKIVQDVPTRVKTFCNKECYRKSIKTWGNRKTNA